MRRIALAIVVGLLLGAVAAVAAELRGRIEIAGKGRSARGVLPSEAVVWFTPEGQARISPPAEPLEVATVRKEFEPRVLVVPVGSQVRFPNRDPILHNVFSVSPGNAFDLGLYGRGDGERARFDERGVVRVFCNVHQLMVAYVVVVDTPHWTRPDRDGRFVLTGLPAGRGKLTIWHERAEPWARELEPATQAPFRVRLDVTRPRVPLHTRKDGARYPDPYR